LHSNKVTLYFKALCLTRDSYNGVTKVGTYSDHNRFDSNYYSCGGQGFTRVSWKNVFKPDSANYANSMQIRHHAGGSVRGFYAGSNDSDDVSSVIYSFQEIYALISANPNSHYIKVSNIATIVQVNVGGIMVNFNKHEVIFGPNDLPPQKTSNNSGIAGAYYNTYADLGNMCPPSCTSITYTLQ
ncbi:MAG TPA: hypothetical protein VNZ45_17215, partial [Bacteroidia bacterium]|nr:hypothetical protein [Bacteroidia bacterium]